MKAYLPNDVRGREAANIALARHGFDLMGVEIVPWKASDGVAALDALMLTRETVLMGGVGFVHRALHRIGVPIPHLPSIPAPLLAFAPGGRQVVTVGEAYRRFEGGERFFAKPLAADRKRFKGTPVRAFRDLLALGEQPTDLRIEIAELTDFISEYRGFMLRNALIDLRSYKGDHLVFPDRDTIEAAVAAMRNRGPIAYSIDFGVTRSGETKVVECNDAYALGSYGLAALPYARMIHDRWREILGHPPEHLPDP